MNAIRSKSLRYGRTPCASAADLPPQQRQVLALVADGLDNSAIAERLYISRHTVKNHLAIIYDRLGIEEQPGMNARVLAVRRYLEAYPPGGAG